jgi:hypothetical protein
VTIAPVTNVRNAYYSVSIKVQGWGAYQVLHVNTYFKFQQNP